MRRPLSLNLLRVRSASLLIPLAMGLSISAQSITFTQYVEPNGPGEPGTIVAGPDGALWFNDYTKSQIFRITTSGTMTSYPTLTPFSGPRSIVAGPDGALWFAEDSANKIGRITTGGAITEFPLPATLNGPTGIVRGPDGALWFWDNVNGRIGRITTSGVVTSFPIPNLIVDLTVGPDGSTVVYRRGELRYRANYRWWRH